MQKQNKKKIKSFDKKELDVLDRVLRILWRKEVEYKIKSDKSIFEGNIL